MFASLLITVSILGADPQIVFSEDSTGWMSGSASLFAPPFIASAEFAGSVLADNKVRPRTSALSVRGQSVNDHQLYGEQGFATYNDPEPAYESCWHAFWHDPFVEEFVSAMNPFHSEEIKVIPNYYDPFGSQMGTGTYGPPGYRIGWVTYNDITVIPTSTARGTTGGMRIIEWNSYAKYSHLVAPGVLFNGTGWFSARWWDGPGGTDLPGQVDQISTDLELGFFNDGPWSGQIAFHPQIVETYDAKLDHNAFNYDGRAIATYKASPEWSFVGGVAVWDRVNTLIIPHVGVVWTPTDRWEFRILFPKSRISYLLGNWHNADFWLYGQAEYTAEAWQSADKVAETSDRVQFTDERFSVGLRADTGRYSFFIEGGCVIDRHVKFAGATPNFDLSDAGMVRAGLRY